MLPMLIPIFTGLRAADHGGIRKLMPDDVVLLAPLRQRKIALKSAG
ncbi:Uncharacterised protein [Vibrio cholerae]|nr:Uncharacterised protein [Vibrio cholerae]CSI85573.1 Uncharacterised protein [Vibrio cholerae]